MNDDDILAASRDMFLVEAREMVVQLEQALLELNDADADPEVLNSAFRAAHTIKGSAGLFGFDRVVAFTHQVEFLLDKMRSGNHPADATTISLLLDSRDQIGALLDELAGEPDAALAAQSAALISRIQALLGLPSAPAGASAAPAQKAPAASATQVPQDLGNHAPATPEWVVWVRFGPQTFVDGFDPVQFIRYLSTLGEVVDVLVDSSRIPPLAELDAETCHLELTLRLRTTSPKSAIEGAFEFIADSCELRIAPRPYALEQMKAVLAELDVDGSGTRLGEALVQIGALTRHELERALAIQSEGGNTQPLGEILTEQKLAAAPLVKAAVEKQAQQRDKKSEESRFIRVQADKLDGLISLIGELVIAVSSARSIADRRQDAAMLEAAERLETLIEGARDRSLKLRMVPVGETFARFKRIVHDVAKSLDKEADLVITGGETELDKSMVELIVDPLTHLVRNSMDHGLEPPGDRVAVGKPSRGTVRLNAFHDAGAIVIEVADDGRGLSRDKILAKAQERGLINADTPLTDNEVWNLIFLPGFSTAEKVTDISGRGVGMDVVRRNIEALRGEVNLLSRTGQGSTVQIRLPLTLAIIDGFLVECAGSTFVLPLDGVEECVENPGVGDHDAASFFELRGEVVPLLNLREHFRLGASTSRRRSVVVLRQGTKRVGLLVDRLLGEHQTVIKPLGQLFQRLKAISGSTIMGSGEVALILDVAALIGDATAQRRQLPTESTASAVTISSA